MQCDMNLTSKNSQSTNQNSRNDVEKKLWYNYKTLYHWWFDIQTLKDMRTLITTPQKKTNNNQNTWLSKLKPGLQPTLYR